MIIKQLSVFLENKTGRLSEVTSILGDEGINMTAFSLAETSEFGILRLIVSEPDKALKSLKDAGFSVSLTEVVCLSCPNKAGALAKALRILKEEGVVIEYMYAFSMSEDASANIIIRPADVKRCIEVLQEHKLELIAASELYKL
jgi:hypothetical protein